MQFSLIQIIAILIHFIGMLLICLSYINIAILTHLGCTNKIQRKFFPGTKLLLTPLLLALGGVGFIFLNVILILSILSLATGFSQNLRYFGVGVALIANLLALYGTVSFYNRAKQNISGGN